MRPRSSSQARSARSVSPERFSGSNNASPYCYCCSSHQHRASSSSCPAQGQRCFHCDRIGHFRSVCNRRQRRSTAFVHEVDCQDLSSDAEGLSVLTVAGPARARIFVDIFIAGKSLKFLVDSGSSVFILEESIFKQHFANESLLSAPRVKLLDYSKRCIPVRGCFFAEVTLKGRTAYLLFYVVAEGSTSILGIDTIRVLDLQIEGSSLHSSRRRRCQRHSTPLSSQARANFRQPTPFRRPCPASSAPSSVRALGLRRASFTASRLDSRCLL
ncbi:hypothetical protein MTO96_038901 [Rhipicephalus appendiculatus]